MPRFVVQEAEGVIDTTPIPDDTMCTATLLGTSFKMRQYPDEPAPVERMVWKFRIEEPAEFFDRFVWGETGTKVTNHPSCRIYAWAAAVLGINPLPVEYGFDPEDLWHKQCRVLVGARPGKDKKGEDRIFNYVEDVLPISGVPAVAGINFDDDEF